MKYKVGDKVRIKSYETLMNELKEGIDIMSGLLPFLYGGKVVTITDIKGDFYRIDLFDDGFYWADFLFEKVEHSNDKDILHDELVKDIADIINKHNLSVKIEERDGGLFVKPIEKENDLPIDTPCMCFLNGWILRYYAGNKKCFIDGMNSNSLGEGKPVESISYKVIIPFSSFNVDDIESSLKYNIVK